MNTRKMLLIIGVILLIGLGGFFVYLNLLGSMWVINRPDTRPFYLTTKPMLVKNILLPEGSKIIYKKQHFWQKGRQDEPLKEEDIREISFREETTINWAGVPITFIAGFYNSEMKGFSVYSDFDNINKKTRFSDRWQDCGGALGITVKNENDWSFNKENILNIESCGVNYQRYFKDDKNQQKYLDSLYNELMLVEE